MAEVYGIQEWDMERLTFDGYSALMEDAERKSKAAAKKG